MPGNGWKKCWLTKLATDWPSVSQTVAHADEISADPLEQLHHGRIDALVAAISSLPAPTIEALKLIPTTIAYFAKRRAMLDYPSFRAKGYQIGSGLAESACKRLVSQREKGAGRKREVGGERLATTLAAICQPRLIGESSPTVDLEYVE